MTSSGWAIKYSTHRSLRAGQPRRSAAAKSLPQDAASRRAGEAAVASQRVWGVGLGLVGWGGGEGGGARQSAHGHKLSSAAFDPYTP